MIERVRFECSFKPRPKKGEWGQKQWDKEYGGESTLQGCGHRWIKRMTDAEIKAMFGPDGRREACPVCGKIRPVGFSLPSTTKAVNDALFGRRGK